MVKYMSDQNNYRQNNTLVGGDELFFHNRFTNHFIYMKNEWKPRYSKPIAFFLSCSKHKPYYKSPYRRLFNAMLSKKLGLTDVSQIYTVSEPAVLVPREMEDSLVTAYDFPPENLGVEGRKIFTKRLGD